MTLKIVQVVRGWDMRKVHELRESIRARALQPGQCIVAVNNALDMARIIDCEGGVTNRYADVGEEFDLAGIAAQMQRGLGVDMDTGRHERPRVTSRGRLREAA